MLALAKALASHCPVGIQLHSHTTAEPGAYLERCGLRVRGLAGLHLHGGSQGRPAETAGSTWCIQETIATQQWHHTSFPSPRSPCPAGWPAAWVPPAPTPVWGGGAWGAAVAWLHSPALPRLSMPVKKDVHREIPHELSISGDLAPSPASPPGFSCMRPTHLCIRRSSRGDSIMHSCMAAGAPVVQAWQPCWVGGLLDGEQLRLTCARCPSCVAQARPLASRCKPPLRSPTNTDLLCCRISLPVLCQQAFQALDGLMQQLSLPLHSGRLCSRAPTIGCSAAQMASAARTLACTDAAAACRASRAAPAPPPCASGGRLGAWASAIADRLAIGAGKRR